MRLLVVMMLGCVVPSIAEPPLSEGQRLFQGVWQLTVYESGERQGTLRIDGRDFHADGVHGRYVGHVTIRSDTSPAQADFTVEDCECSYKGKTSTGIYYEEDDGSIVLTAPVPGDPRPEAFVTPNSTWRLLPATEGEQP